MEVLNDGVCYQQWHDVALLSHTDSDIQTTYCHVFHIHVSLSLQLSYYLPVEPL